MASIIEDIKSLNKNLLFGFLCISVILITYFTANTLVSEELYFNNFGEQMNYDQIRSFLDMQYKYQWITYLVLPVIYLLKLSLLTLVLLAGTIFWNIKISFTKLFQIALIAEFLFILPAIIKLLWFMFVKKDYELMDLQTFYPLSLLNLLNAKDMPQWLIYPLQLVNVFELLYWFILSYGIALVTKERWPKMLGLVASSYGVALFVWVVFITFITINLT
jgi:hypothetical protein